MVQGSICADPMKTHFFSHKLIRTSSVKINLKWFRFFARGNCEVL